MAVLQAVHSAVATYARSGNLEAVKSLINSGNVGINDPINKAEDSILHAAISQNRFKVVEYLVGIGANVNAANQQGTTPLMVAVSSSRNPKLVRLLLDVGADPTRRHFQLRKTALDFAADAGYRAAEELLNEATNGEPMRTSDLQDDQHDRAKPRKPCCPFCGVKIKGTTRLDHLMSTPSTAQDDNPYVRSFLASQVCRTVATVPNYHILTGKRHLRKEITESWAIISAIQKLVARHTDMDMHTLQLVDLCAGNSLTTAMFGLLYPRATGIAVDIMPPSCVPHLDGTNLSYLQSDIMAKGFEEILQSRLTVDAANQRGAAILVGMHLCGALSIRAIELFNNMPILRAIILSPCCFPKHRNKSSTDRNGLVQLLQSCGDDEAGKYMTWSTYLHDLVQPTCVVTGLYRDDCILSNRDTIIVGCRNRIS